MIRLIGILLFLITSISAIAQLGVHPAHIRWQQIDSKNVRVIFPEGIADRAGRVADVIEHINANNTYSVGDRSKKLDVVIQSSQVISNGFVTLSPYRSEFFATGFQNLNIVGTLDWLDALAIHEYRHALQFTNSNRGATKFLNILQGQQGWGLGMVLSVPNWYFEGDATLSETLLSNAGRGRTPSFQKTLRANLLQGRTYSYMTSRNGSLKRLLPNHYTLGYALCNYTRNQYGMDVWKDILADAGSYKKVVYPFSRAMKAHTGKRTKEVYNDAYDKLLSDWQLELDTLSITPTVPVLSPKSGVVTSYRFPQILDDGSIIALKSSYQEIPRLVRIDGGRESELMKYAFSTDSYLSENNGVLAWTELQQDPRRANQNYNRIVTFDVSKGVKNYVVSKTKYFSPHISAEGDRIVVVEADQSLQNQLLIIDAKDGRTLAEIPNPKNDFLSYPKWTRDDRAIVFTARRNSKVALVKYDLINQVTTMLTDWTSHVIGVTDLSREKVYFSASFSGIDNIYTVNLSGDKIIKKLTSVEVGVYEPTISSEANKLVTAEFTDMGYSLSSHDLDRGIESYETITYAEPVGMARYNIQTNPQEENILDRVTDGNHEPASYNGFFKGLKLHDWSFGSQTSIDPGLSVSLTNILSSLEANMGAFYNINEKTTNYTFDAAYGKWFAEVGLHGQVLNRSTPYVGNTSVVSEFFREANYGVSLSVPLSWLKTNVLFEALPSIQYTGHHTSQYKNEATVRDNLNFGTITSGLSFVAIRRRALQNIYPRFGVVLDLEQQSAINTVSAARVNTNSSFYLPGFHINHGVKIDAGWQKEVATNTYQFADLFFYSRGYNAVISDEAYRIAFNYAFPLVYPDWGFGGLVYCKRIRANLFYDMGRVKLDQTTTNLNSLGAELIFDTNVFNLLPVAVGLRQSFLLNTDASAPNRTNRFEVFFTADL